MSFLRSKIFISIILFSCFVIPYTANAFLPALIGVMLRFTPSASKFMKAGIKAVKPAKRISPTKFELSLSTARGLENRVLQVFLGTGVSAATSLALWLGYKDTLSTSSNCSGTHGFSLDASLGSYSSASSFYSAVSSVIHASDPAAILGGYSIYQSGLSLDSYQFYNWGGSSGLVLNQFICSKSLSTQTALSNFLVDVELNPSQLQTDNIVNGLKAMSPTDWDSIVEMMGTGSIQPASDYFTGDSISVDSNGNITLNGVALEAATYVGADGLVHTLTLDENGNVLVDGQLSTGFTASNPSAGSPGPVTTTGTTTTTVTTDPATGVQTTVTSETSTEPSGASSTITTTTTYNPTTGVTVTDTVATTTPAPAPDALAVADSGISDSFDNFGLGVGKTIRDQFGGLTNGGGELCFDSAFAGTHCLSDFDKGGIWTGYVRTFFGFLGGLLAFFIPLYVALRL